jgi:hypothetical protein
MTKQEILKALTDIQLKLEFVMDDPLIEVSSDEFEYLSKASENLTRACISLKPMEPPTT